MYCIPFRFSIPLFVAPGFATAALCMITLSLAFAIEAFSEIVSQPESFSGVSVLHLQNRLQITTRMFKRMERDSRLPGIEINKINKQNG